MSALPDITASFVRESPIFRAPIVAVVQRAAQESPPGTRVLDAGSGSQPYRPLFAHCHYMAQDWAGSVHPQAQRAEIIADVADLPVEDEYFDLVVCTEVLEHVPEPGRVLDEILRVTAKGGRLVLTVPFVIELHEEPHDHFRYTSYGLRGLLERAGFEQIEVLPLTGWFSTLAAMMRNARGAMVPRDRRPTLRTRLAGLVVIALSEPIRLMCPWLDRLDQRRSLPLGWSATARRPTA